LGYLLILTTSTVATLFGFAFIGLGFSVMVPELFRIGGTVPGVDSSQGVAFIAGMGYSGFLSGPVILGFLAEEFQLTTSFWTLLACAFVILLLTAVLRGKKT